MLLFCQNLYVYEYLFLYNNLYISALQEFLTPIRQKRKEYEKDKKAIMQMLKKGTDAANLVANKTLQEVKKAMGIVY